VGAAGPWAPDDRLPGWEARTLPLADDGDHPVATLVRRAPGGPPAGTPAPERVLLHLHGFSDYFFHPHLADVHAPHGYATYALELRRYGRSLRPGQRPYAGRSLDDYDEELTAALDVVGAEVPGPVVVLAHSLGGLVVARYAASGARRDAIAALVLNSPFLALPLPRLARPLVPLVAALGRVAPDLPVARLTSANARGLHRSTGGAWDFDLALKPLGGVVVRAGWLRSVVRAQAEVAAGLDLRCPVLVLRAERSRRDRQRGEGLDAVDAVLDVHDIERLAPHLGRDVTVVAIPGGVHDLTLAPPDVRASAFEVELAWLAAHGLA
jgi:alpha-beta hydrolase superfamily lysophospholipase